MAGRQKAALKARQLLKAAGWDGSLPIQPEKIASAIRFRSSKDGEFYPIVFQHISNPEDLNLSGQAYFGHSDGQKAFICEYNPHEYTYRSQFTKAHELGHIILGHVGPDSGARKRDELINDRDPDETDANSFAAELLMPDHLVHEAVRRSTNISKMASWFGVSPTAFRYRLKNLGIL